ncbi:MAG: ATPase, T2SS/T4P/T4SS family [Candidatus ainarchaeum sp.]|nr:ATPase, T2SS/T4P/T4SS family [Candidatus ainarchaeum sp.]
MNIKKKDLFEKEIIKIKNNGAVKNNFKKTNIDESLKKIVNSSIDKSKKTKFNSSDTDWRVFYNYPVDDPFDLETIERPELKDFIEYSKSPRWKVFSSSESVIEKPKRKDFINYVRDPRWKVFSSSESVIEKPKEKDFIEYSKSPRWKVFRDDKDISWDDDVKVIDKPKVYNFKDFKSGVSWKTFSSNDMIIEKPKKDDFNSPKNLDKSNIKEKIFSFKEKDPNSISKYLTDINNNLSAKEKIFDELKENVIENVSENNKLTSQSKNNFSSNLIDELEKMDKNKVKEQINENSKTKLNESNSIEKLINEINNSSNENKNDVENKTDSESKSNLDLNWLKKEITEKSEQLSKNELPLVNEPKLIENNNSSKHTLEPKWKVFRDDPNLSWDDDIRIIDKPKDYNFKDFKSGVSWKTFSSADMIIEKPTKEDFDEKRFLAEDDLFNLTDKNFDVEKIKEATVKSDNLKKVKSDVQWKHVDKSVIELNDFDESKINYSQMKTPIDYIFQILEERKVVDSGKLSQAIGLNYFDLEIILKQFEEIGVIELSYRASINHPLVILKNKITTKFRPIPEGKIIDSYNIVVDFVPVEIKIVEVINESRPIYCLSMPCIGPYTSKFLDFIKDEIVEQIPIEIDEMMDPKKAKQLKARFFDESKKFVVKYLPKLSNELLPILCGTILHEMYGLGDIEVILGDDKLEEVTINSSKTPLTVYHLSFGWLKTNFFLASEEEIFNYASLIGRKIGRQITNLEPILDAHLLSGDRVNATLFPITSEGNTITIRRFARKPWTITDFVGIAHTMNTEMAAFLWLAMQYEMNVLIAGGTASGKTSTLNTLLSFIPSYHRLISIEDVREITLPKFLTWNWVPMVTRSPNPEGLGEVTMLDCMVSSLRMRPDRIIVGEIRRQKEAEVLMEAIETGHSIYSTMHSNSAYQVLRRLSEAPINIPPVQIELIDLVVVQFRDRKTNKRRTYEIAEIEHTNSGKGLEANTVYKWMPRSDSWDQLNKPHKLLTTLNIHTGLTEDEIYSEIEERKEILEWMVKQKIDDLDTIGYVMKLFYADKSKIQKMIKTNYTFEKVKWMMLNE